MNKQKKKGIILIVIGICIPLFILPFVSGYEKDKGVWHNFYNVGIKIKNDTHIEKSKISVGNGVDQASKKPFSLKKFIPERIPLRWFLAFTFLFLYIGIIKIDNARSGRKKAENIMNEE